MKITVFTPTYNRAYILSNLYHSLQRQSFRDFEWLIVDDGSTDDTDKLVQSWIDNDKNDFNIRYYKKQNGGKCRAINYGVDLAQGILFFNVDSDDYLTDDALEKVDKWEKELPKDGKYCGVVGNLGISATETPNTSFEGPFRDAILLERYSDYSDNPIDGEHAFIFYTEIQKKYKYPEFDGERFVTPAVTWNRMANDGYRVHIYNDIIWIYEYQPDGLTANVGKNFINNPQGHGLWQKEMAEFCHYNFKKKIMMWFSFYCDHKHHLNNKQIAQYIGAPRLFIDLFSIIKKR